MYAGFWKRFGAFILDYVILIILNLILVFIWAGFELLLNSTGVQQSIKENILGDLGIPIFLLMPLLYYAFFESSKLMATPGKLALGISVVNVNGEKITFLRAIGRFISKFLSYLIFYMGFIMAGFTQKKQALHDYMVGTYVINKIDLPKATVEEPETL